MTELVVNHLTRMKDDRVCVAGLTGEGTHVRPLLSGRRPWTDGHVHPGGPLRLGSVLIVTGTGRADPPHTEDVVVDQWDVGGRCSYQAFLAALEAAAQPLARCFGTPHQVVPGRRLVVAPGSGTSSLAVVRVLSADLFERGGGLRVGLEHEQLGDLDLGVNDLRFVPWTRRREHMPRLSHLLAVSGAWLTVGLTRPYGQGEQWCWVQINGIFVADAELTGW